MAHDGRPSATGQRAKSEHLSDRHDSDAHHRREGHHSKHDHHQHAPPGLDLPAQHKDRRERSPLPSPTRSTHIKDGISRSHSPAPSNAEAAHHTDFRSFLGAHAGKVLSQVEAKLEELGLTQGTGSPAGKGERSGQNSLLGSLQSHLAQSGLLPQQPSSTQSQSQPVARPVPPVPAQETPQPRASKPSTHFHGLKANAKPRHPRSSRQPHNRHHSHFHTSYPPSVERSCLAEDAAADVLHSGQHAWWNSHMPIAPILVNNSDAQWASGTEWADGVSFTLGYALFCELSQVWYRVNNSTGQIEALFAPRPHALSQHDARTAAHTYNEQIARFAEAQRGPVGNGECWTLASEAIKSVDKSLPPPIHSLSRTHGSIIYEDTFQEGRWHGGDLKVRRGDIVEWKEAKCGEKGKPGVVHQLGFPEHTAVIVADADMRQTPHDGASLPPSALGSLEVIEQSHGKNPSRTCYDLSTMSAGEIWIYRPCSRSALGLVDPHRAVWPPPVTAFRPSS